MQTSSLCITSRGDSLATPEQELVPVNVRVLLAVPVLTFVPAMDSFTSSVPSFGSVASPT